jgi:hypothetical protein
MGRASTAMGAVMALRPERATRLSDPDTVVPVEDIKVGETVLVKPGQMWGLSPIARHVTRYRLNSASEGHVLFISSRSRVY